MLPAPLSTHPRLPGYEFLVVAGTVLSEAVVPRTQGAGPPPGVNPNARRYREIWIGSEERGEVKLFADADQLELREGHRVTLVVAARADGARFVVQAWNHDAPQYGTVVESAVSAIGFDFPGQTGCMVLPAIAIVGAQLLWALAGYAWSRAAGALAAALFFAGVISLWLRRGDRDRRIRLAREAALRERLSAIAGALSLPPAGGAGPGG
jgi:hypothetical protein